MTIQRIQRIGLPLIVGIIALAGLLFWLVNDGDAPHQPQGDLTTAIELARKFYPEFVAGPGSTEKGIELAATHCVNCHLASPTDALPAKSWQELFPLKYTALFDREAWHKAGRHLAISDELAQQNALSKEQFATIVFAYLSLAPKESLPQVGKPPMSETNAPFTVIAKFQRDKQEKMYSTVEWDPYDKLILAGDANAQTIDRFSPQGEPMGEVPFDGIPTAILPGKEGIIVNSIGGSFFSFDKPDGKLMLMPRWPPLAHRILLDGLRRPVTIELTDFNGDGVKEALIPEFGFTRGSLSLYDPATQKKKRVLVDNAGSVAAKAIDMNGDGDEDIITLVSQNLEVLTVLTNDGYGNFSTDVVFQGHPSFGSNALAVGDLNDDGLEDLVMSAGDNFDLQTQPLRNYHGVRIFYQAGKGGFNQPFFYPMYGSIDVEVGDFDGDGDGDIVAVSFFPDWSAENPETAVYLENVGPEGFIPHRIPGADGGRWITIASPDLNGDGLDDLVLGAAYSPMLNKDWDARFGRDTGDALLILQADPRTSRP